jgi:hypothetical protein
MLQRIFGGIIRPLPGMKTEMCLIIYLYTVYVYIVFYVRLSVTYDNSSGMVLYI